MVKLWNLFSVAMLCSALGWGDLTSNQDDITSFVLCRLVAVIYPPWKSERPECKTCLPTSKQAKEEKKTEDNVEINKYIISKKALLQNLKRVHHLCLETHPITVEAYGDHITRES